jgi:glycosyltransferase involved in cell wall biosynthesis
MSNSSGKTILFVMPCAYPTIAGRKEVGGAELQSWMIAKGLARKAQVFFIVNEKGETLKEKDGVRIVNLRSGNAPQTFFMIFRKILDISPDYIYQRTGGNLTSFLSIASKILRKKFVFHVSRNEQLDHEYPYDGSNPSRVLYRLGLKWVNQIIVQNQEQQSLAKNGILIPNMIEVGGGIPKKEDFVLWVSSIAGTKRPEMFVELARRNPGIRFKMIGKVQEERFRKLDRKVREGISKIPNLEYLGQKTLEETNRYFSRARVFVNTSSLEGFPNTYLQALKSGTPIVSLGIDPSSMLKQGGVGFCCKNIDEASGRINELVKDDKLWKNMSGKCLSYLKGFDYEVLIKEYEKVFEL